MAEVAGLIAESIAAHALYKQHRPRMVKQGQALRESAGDPAAARAALERAASLLQQALEADPETKDPAWAAHPHKELRAFYQRELEKP